MISQKRMQSSCVLRGLALSGLVATWAFAVCVLAWFVLRLYPGDRWLPVRLANYFAPWILIALVLGVVVAVMGKRAILAGVMGLLTLTLLTRFWPVLTPPLSSGTFDVGNVSGQLKVMTFNAHYSNRNAQGIAELIREANPDVIALQECSPELNYLLQAELHSDYGFFLPDDDVYTRLLLVSRYPLQSNPPPSTAWRTQRVNVSTPFGPMTVWNIHSAPSVTDSGWEWQRETFATIGQDIRAEQGPLVVLGDLNTTDQNENYHLLADQLIDIHRVVGWGFGFTFPDRWRDKEPSLGLRVPVVRIDHILVSNHWAPEDVEVISDGYGSDHRPVVGTIRLNQ